MELEQKGGQFLEAARDRAITVGVSKTDAAPSGSRPMVEKASV